MFHRQSSLHATNERKRLLPTCCIVSSSSPSPISLNNSLFSLFLSFLILMWILFSTKNFSFFFSFSHFFYRTSRLEAKKRRKFAVCYFLLFKKYTSQWNGIVRTGKKATRKEAKYFLCCFVFVLFNEQTNEPIQTFKYKSTKVLRLSCFCFQLFALIFLCFVYLFMFLSMNKGAEVESKNKSLSSERSVYWVTSLSSAPAGKPRLKSEERKTLENETLRHVLCFYDFPVVNFFLYFEKVKKYKRKVQIVISRIYFFIFFFHMNLI